MKYHKITLEYINGLGSFLDELNYAYETELNDNGCSYYHILCSKVPTMQDVWNLADEFNKWKNINTF